MISQTFIFLIIGYLINLVIILIFGYFIWKTMKYLIKTAVIEGFHEYDRSSKMRKLEDTALARVTESRKKFS